jgi:anti-sigma factor RsiW
MIGIIPAIGHPARRRPTRSKRQEPTRQKDSATVTCHKATVTCKDATDLLGDYLTDSLNSKDRRAFEAHLAACRDCTAFLATYKRTLSLTKSFLRSQSLQAPPADFKLRLPTAR